MTDNNNDDINIYNMFVSIWLNKHIVIIVTIVSSIITFLYINYLQTNYGIKVNYNLNICYPENNRNCSADKALNSLHLLYSGTDLYNNIEVNSLNIIYKNSDLKYLKNNFKKIKKANIIMTKDYLDTALTNLNMIEEQFLSKKINILDSLQSEFIAQKKIVNKIENGINIFEFGDPITIEYPKLSNFVILVMLLLGPFISLIIIFLKENYLKNLKSKLS